MPATVHAHTTKSTTTDPTGHPNKPAKTGRVPQNGSTYGPTTIIAIYRHPVATLTPIANAVKAPRPVTAYFAAAVPTPQAAAAASSAPYGPAWMCPDT